MDSGVHENFSRGEGIKGSSDRSFGFVFAAFFALVGLAPLLHKNTVHFWALGASAALLAIALAKPSLLRPANYLWTRAGWVLNLVVSPVVMGLLFFLIATPTGVLMRLSGKDPLRLKFDSGAASYWLPRTPPGPPPETMSNQF